MSQRIELLNINNNIREDWIKTIDSIRSFCEDEYDEALHLCEVIDNMKEKKPKYYRLFVSVMFSDYYKLLYCCNVQEISYYMDTDRLEFFDELTDLDDLLQKIEDDRSLLDEIVLQIFTYNDYDYYGKKEIMKLIEPRNKYLFKMCPTHVLDLIEMAKTYSAEELLYFYQDYLERYGVSAYLSAIESILATMSALYENDIENYKEVLVDMISVYYKWKKYLKNNSKNITHDESELIEMLERQPMDVIFDISNKYPLVLEEIVGGYLLFSTEKTKISNDEVERYINNNVDNKIKKKLRLFKP